MPDLPALPPECPSYWRAIIKFALSETREHQKRELIASTMMSVVVAFVSGFGTASPVTGLVSAGLTFAGIMLLIFVSHLLRYPRYVYHEHANTRAALQLSVKEPEPLPEISVKIIEAFIDPDPARSFCFLHVKLHNTVSMQCDLPPDIEAFSLSIKLKDDDKVYESHRVADVFNDYYLSIYEDASGYDEENGGYYESEREIRREHLWPKRATLRRAMPLYRWIGFELRGLPPWPVRKERTGRSVEVPVYEDDTIVDYEWEEDVNYIRTSSNVETLTLTVIDPFDRPHSHSKSPPFYQYGRRIVKVKRRGLEPDVPEVDSSFSVE